MTVLFLVASSNWLLIGCMAELQLVHALRLRIVHLTGMDA